MFWAGRATTPPSPFFLLLCSADCTIAYIDNHAEENHSDALLDDQRKNCATPAEASSAAVILPGASVFPGFAILAGMEGQS
jgi:hypothetical protein